MKHCIECGTQLVEKQLEGEGIIPYCPVCEQFRFPMFNAAVSVIIFNAAREKILLIQQYKKVRNILVAGYINLGESAEHAVAREILEEVGLDAVDIKFNKSEYYEKSNTLMFNFSCSVRDDKFKIDSKEVDYAAWYPVEEAKEAIADGSLAERFLLSYLEKRS